MGIGIQQQILQFIILDPTTDPGIQQQILQYILILQYLFKNAGTRQEVDPKTDPPLYNFGSNNRSWDPTTDPSRPISLDLTTDPRIQQQILQL